MNEQPTSQGDAAGAAQVFSVRDVARIFGLKEARLRYWALTGFINPSGKLKGGQRSYTFSDLVEIKAAHGLIEAGIPLQRVRRTLKALRQAMPDEPTPLARMRVQCDGDHLVVTDEAATFNPVSGQLVLDFELDEVGQQAAEVLDLAEAAARRRPTTKTPELRISPLGSLEGDEAQEGEEPSSAYGWFLRGCALDEQGDRVEQALAAYQRALELDPGLAAAQTNLGNLYYRLDQRTQALRCYEHACSLDPEQAEARYNLANLYEEEGDYEQAIAEYREALRQAPDFADVHFNLALTLERMGSRAQAIRHWRRYLELAEDGEVGDVAQDDPWHGLAVEHLGRLEGGAEDR